MQMWADVQLDLAETRRRELEVQAAASRLAATSPRPAGNAGLRGSIGRALIRTGQLLAPEPPVGPSHRHHRVAARQP